MRKSTTKMPWMSPPQFLVATGASISEVAPCYFAPLEVPAQAVMRGNGVVEKFCSTPSHGVILIVEGKPQEIDIRSPGTKRALGKGRGRQTDSITESAADRNNPESWAKRLAEFTTDENKIEKPVPDLSGGARSVVHFSAE